ncbi:MULTISPECIES: hypothetical protein [unclassified Streptomyces]|uniref:hypothetical protein n=1 Tax=unclassified Streptomyces TaxID=2593676 RepID=UPI00131DE403|nr:hypothetical protein [Streptomyces sp. NRRL F-5630]
MVNVVEQLIAQAMDQPNDRIMVDGVKSAVANHFRRLDPHATVTLTEFFNHTHVPDMVVQWPTQPRTPRRFIYLRTTANEHELQDDLERLPATESPVLLTLGRFPAQRASVESSLRRAIDPKLLLDTPALDALQPQVERPNLPQLVSRSVLEGGRGKLDGPETERFVATVARGAEAARTGDTEPTREAIDALTGQMTVDVSDRMAAFLAALWQGGGASLASFPGPQRLLGQLDETALTYLLESEAIPDTRFWNRVVRMLSLPTLLRTAVSDSENLQHLMRQAIQSWTSRVCMIMPESAPSDAGPWRWGIRAGRLILQAPGFQVMAAQSRRQLPTAEEHDLPLLNEIRARAARFNIPLTSLSMVVTDRHVGYGGPGDDISRDVQLDGISSALGQAEGVIEADAKVASGVTLQCAFGTRTASARGARTQVRLDTLFGTTVRMLLPLSDDEAEQIADLLGAQGPPPDQPWTQPTFDGV